MANQNETNRPTTTTRIGRFQISLWENQRLTKAKHDYDAEREHNALRACVQHGTFNKTTQTWENQSIWCNPDELRDLANALDQFSPDI